MPTGSGQDSGGLGKTYHELSAWERTHCRPVLNALNTHRFEQARQELANAREQLQKNELPAGARESLSLKLDFYVYRIKWHPEVEGWSAADFEHAVERFSRPAQTELGEYERIRVMLILHLFADKEGHKPLNQQALEDMLSRLPDEYRQGLVWFSVAAWAYRHRVESLLEQAFESLLLQPSDTMGQAKWQRVNLMYQLMKGKAVRRDVEESIRLLAIKSQAHEFMHDYWPDCVKAGITDSQLEEKLNEKMLEIESSMAEPPRERRTKNIRNRL